MKKMYSKEMLVAELESAGIFYTEEVQQALKVSNGYDVINLNASYKIYKDSAIQADFSFLEFHFWRVCAPSTADLDHRLTTDKGFKKRNPYNMTRVSKMKAEAGLGATRNNKDRDVTKQAQEQMHRNTVLANEPTRFNSPVHLMGLPNGLKF